MTGFFSKQPSYTLKISHDICPQPHPQSSNEPRVIRPITFVKSGKRVVSIDLHIFPYPGKLFSDLRGQFMAEGSQSDRGKSYHTVSTIMLYEYFPVPLTSDKSAMWPSEHHSTFHSVPWHDFLHHPLYKEIVLVLAPLEAVFKTSM